MSRLLAALVYLGYIALGALGTGAMAMAGARIPEDDPWL